MQTKYPAMQGSVPNLGTCLNIGVLPNYFQRNYIEINCVDGSVKKTGHIASDGRRFNWRTAYNSDHKWEYLHFLQFSYLDEDGNTKIIDVEPRNPHLINHGPELTKVGYVTKINGLRWGVVVHFNYQSGDMQIISDEGSPIIGTLIQLI